MTTNDPPPWIFDLLIELQQEDHEALQHVPWQVAAEAKALARFRAEYEADRQHVELVDKQRADLAASIRDQTRALAQALGLDEPKHFHAMTEMVEELRGKR